MPRVRGMRGRPGQAGTMNHAMPMPGASPIAAPIAAPPMPMPVGSLAHNVGPGTLPVAVPDVPTPHVYRTMPVVGSLLPKGVTQTPEGDIGQHRQAESVLAGGFTVGRVASASRSLPGGVGMVAAHTDNVGGVAPAVSIQRIPRGGVPARIQTPNTGRTGYVSVKTIHNPDRAHVNGSTRKGA